MKQTIRKCVIVLLMAAVSACTTMQEVKPRDGQVVDRLEIGDHIIVYSNAGEIIDMRFVRIDGEVMRGSLFGDGLETVAIRLDQIERIDAERIAAGKTTAAVLGGIVLAPIAAVGAGISLAEH